MRKVAFLKRANATSTAGAPTLKQKHSAQAQQLSHQRAHLKCAPNHGADFYSVQGIPFTFGMINRPQLKVITETAFEGLKTTLAIMISISGNVAAPGLQVGLMGLEAIIELSQEFLGNDDRITRLLERVVNLDTMLQNTLSDRNTFPPQLYTRVIRTIKVWEIEASKITALRDRSSALRWITAKKDAELIQGSLDAVNQSIQDFLLECAFNTEVGVLRVQHDLTDLKRLTEFNAHLLQSTTSHPPLSDVMVLKRLIPKDPVYLDVKSLFEDRWVNDQLNVPKIKAIYQICSWSPRAIEHHEKYSQYRTQLRQSVRSNRLVEEPLFHTHPMIRACTLGDDHDHAHTAKPCFNSSCVVCHILRCDLSTDLVRNTDRNAYWGHGFYLTTASNKANYYAQNGPGVESPNRVVLLSKILVGTPKSMAMKDSSLRAALPGTHSIKAITRDHGGVVRFSERVVYRADAICPWVMIVCEPATTSKVA
ncbi:hypothetical protein ONZ45_g5099 [Pleurotus djamor]|nr:hypothetical protein ONZ45_g5099 [Pleurotus djamor]